MTLLFSRIYILEKWLRRLTYDGHSSNQVINAPLFQIIILTMATGLSCSVAACTYSTTTQVPDETDIAAKIQLLQIDASSVHQGGGAGHAQVVKAKMAPPKLKPGVDQ